MSYEIPQNLKYEEKIVFGLTLKQFAWIALFGTIGAVIYLKTGLNFYIKGILAIILLGIGLGFAYLNFYGHLKIFNGFFRSKREMGYLSKEIESFIQIKEIENDALFLKDGTIKAIIQVIPLHFSMLSPEEQRAIINSYREFLNSLDFPVQIVMRTVNLSLNDYLTVLEKKVHHTKKSALRDQFDSFKRFIQKFISEKKIKNRLFYIIIPATSNNSIPFMKIKMDKKLLLGQLDVRVKICQEKLKKCNLLTKRLNTEELVSMLSSFFEGFIEVQNHYFAILTTLKLSEKVEGEKNETNKRNWINSIGEKIQPAIK